MSLDFPRTTPVLRGRNLSALGVRGGVQWYDRQAGSKEEMSLILNILPLSLLPSSTPTPRYRNPSIQLFKPPNQDYFPHPATTRSTYPTSPKSPTCPTTLRNPATPLHTDHALSAQGAGARCRSNMALARPLACHLRKRSDADLR
jgi:hypothetical protein